MKKILKNALYDLIKYFSSSKHFWRVYRPIAEVNAEIYYKKSEEKKNREQLDFYNKYKSLIAKTVNRGPFKGLKYPFVNAIHSTIFPKLLGFYEMELHEVLDRISQKPYRTVIDIGCAEGYYAVGFALNYPSAKVFAVDINPVALEKAQTMAEHNGIVGNERFSLMPEITNEFLLNLNPSENHLIFSDCEGFEVTLFSDEVIAYLKNSDFIIESHDFLMPGASDLLMKRFEKTHHIEVIKSIDDVFKYRHINVDDYREIPLLDLRKLLEEKRPTQMEWLFCQSKK